MLPCVDMILDTGVAVTHSNIPVSLKSSGLQWLGQSVPHSACAWYTAWPVSKALHTMTA
jgi:hypothetical protein